MRNAIDLQVQLFNHIKVELPAHLSLVSELADLLELSHDSVYRRMRGEKPLSLSELKRICDRYKISLDQLLHLETESVVFQAPGINTSSPDLQTHLKDMEEQMRFFSSFTNPRILYLCKDVPFWYFFLFPEIAAFKVFFWSKTIMNQPAFANQLFSLKDELFTESIDAGRRILTLYNAIPSVELWNLESIHSTIHQVSFYKEAGIFKQPDDLQSVINSLHQMLNHLQQQCESGTKFLPGTAANTGTTLEFYVNEIILGSNTILAELNERRWAMITYNVLNYIIASDDRFVAKNFNSFNTLLRRAVLISKTGEKERHKFFNTLRERIYALSK